MVPDPTKPKENILKKKKDFHRIITAVVFVFVIGSDLT